MNLTKDLSKKDKERIYQALQLAKEKHAGQKRAEGVSYIIHCLRVAICLIKEMEIKKTESICGALLHDTLEDTNLKLKDIEKKFGKRVGKIVYALTRIKRRDEAPKNIYQRKYEHFLKILKKDKEIRMIKVCDWWDNIRSWPKIPRTHPVRRKFKRWFKEAKNMYLPLAKTIDEKTFKKMRKTLKEVKEKIKNTK